MSALLQNINVQQINAIVIISKGYPDFFIHMSPAHVHIGPRCQKISKMYNKTYAQTGPRYQTHIRIINYPPNKKCHILWSMFTNEVNYLAMSIPNDSNKANVIQGSMKQQQTCLKVYLPLSSMYIISYIYLSKCYQTKPSSNCTILCQIPYCKKINL